VSDDLGSISVLLEQLKGGDRQAALPIWDRYAERFIRLAARKLRNLPRRLADEELAALDAFASFVRLVEGGGYRRLNDRDDLLQLLAVLTTRKALNQKRDAMRQKRGGGRVVGESAFGAGGDPDDPAGMDLAADGGLSPDFRAALADEIRRLFELLDREDPGGSDRLRDVAELLLQGYTQKEVASRLGVVERTVQRKIDRIKSLCHAANVEHFS
jgi:DNA-directed RNA polymerase specialized sigma24 family protein